MSSPIAHDNNRTLKCVPKSSPARCQPLRRVLDSVREEVADHCRDLRSMGLEGEVARVEEMDHRAGNIASESLGPLRQKEGIVLSPHRQEARLVRTEVILKGRVKCDVALVVAEQVQLDLVGAGAG